MNFLNNMVKKGLLWRELVDTKEIMNNHPPNLSFNRKNTPSFI